MIGKRSIAEWLGIFSEVWTVFDKHGVTVGELADAWADIQALVKSFVK